MALVSTTSITFLTIGFILGFLTHLLLHRQNLDLDKRVAILILASSLSFALLAYLQERELSIFLQAAGLASIGNLLGIKTGELVDNVIRRK